VKKNNNNNLPNHELPRVKWTHYSNLSVIKIRPIRSYWDEGFYGVMKNWIPKFVIWVCFKERIPTDQGTNCKTKLSEQEAFDELRVSVFDG